MQNSKPVKHKKRNSSTSEKEKWYGTDYSKNPISKELHARCTDISVGNESDHLFKLPERNDFIPDDFTVYAKPTTATDPDKTPPVILENEPSSRLWFKQDEEFLLPKCCVFLHFRSPVVYQDPKHNAISSLFVDLLRDSLTEYSYNAELAGLRYSLSNGRYGFSLNVNGYNQKQKILLEKLVDKMVHFSPDADRFRILKERYVRNLKNFAMEQPYQHAIYFTNILLTDKVWTKDEILKEAESKRKTVLLTFKPSMGFNIFIDLTLEELKSFKPKFLEAMHIEAYVHGNATEDEARKLMDTVRTTIKKSVPLKPLYSTTSHYFQAENRTHSNSALEVVLQTGVENPKVNMLNELLGQIFNEPCFNQLRTQEQLGYIVFSGLRRSNGCQALRFIVQGDKTPDFMDSRLEAFLIQMEETLKNMSHEDFEKHKTALANIRLERPKKLSSMALKLWNEITAEQYHFSRDKAEVDVLKSLTKEELLQFFETAVKCDAPKRQKLSVYVKSTNNKNEESSSEVKPLPKAEKVDDVVAFKSRLSLYELPKPYRDDIPIAGMAEFSAKL
uniref:Insulin-degrading enzyme n=1 Tax=Romanomermis culicivorax TaxID=13658 RepID=A0A915HZW7_ROMCU